ncbi:dATP/dGTP pyrophosphohydrolase domain-containing protein [Plantactinospora sp. WMMB782]|uniref:dATP/dGTP pyrophosphohydrolase domain-containing protein n=1 Tax=Plantactinospora sp. WMMB782 TaxID=3404121 RepID=UPI003B931A6C
MTQTADLPEYIRKARAEVEGKYPPHVMEAGGPDHYAAGQAQALVYATLAADWDTVREVAADPYADGNDVDAAKEALADAGQPLVAPVAVVDAAHLARQRAFSERTFGPGPRTVGVLDHIRKELAEIEADPTDVGEWVDVLILAFDGAWRAGYEPQQIIDAIVAKQTRNESRTWPDWRTADPNRAIEHDRSCD